MRTPTCPREDAVLRAGAGPGGDELREHARSCAICREVALVASWLERLAEAARAAPPSLPDPRAVLLRARLVERFNAEKRAAASSSRPIAWMDAALVAASLGLAAWLTRWLADAAGGFLLRIGPGDEAAALVGFAATAGLLMLLATVQALSAED